jgi:hypothetical protein
VSSTEIRERMSRPRSWLDRTYGKDMRDYRELKMRESDREYVVAGRVVKGRGSVVRFRYIDRQQYKAREQESSNN